MITKRQFNALILNALGPKLLESLHPREQKALLDTKEFAWLDSEAPTGKTFGDFLDVTFSRRWGRDKVEIDVCPLSTSVQDKITIGVGLKANELKPENIDEFVAFLKEVRDFIARFKQGVRKLKKGKGKK